MASEWNTYHLEELCEFINGFAFKSTDYVAQSADTIEVFRMGYIQRGGGFREDDSPVFVPKKYPKSLEKYFLTPSDIAIAMTDMKDRVAILGNTAWIRDAERFVLNQRVGCIRVKRSDLLDPRFLYFYSNWRPYVEHLRSRANSGVQVNLSTSAIKESELEIPPLSEQRAIAHILGTLDDKIELNRRINATLEAMARALYKSWFVDFDPVRAKSEGRDPGLPKSLADLFPASFEDSELGEIPKGWRVGPLESVLVLQRGFDLPATQRTSGAYPVLAASGPSGKHNKFMVRGPGVTTGRSGVLGKVFYVADNFWPLNTSLWVKEFRHSRPAYAFHLLRRLDFALFNAGSAVPTLNRNHVHTLPTLVPPMKLIDDFERIARTSLYRQKHGERQSTTVAKLRDTLLPKLISGALRIKDGERIIAEET